MSSRVDKLLALLERLVVAQERIAAALEAQKTKPSKREVDETPPDVRPGKLTEKGARDIERAFRRRGLG